MKYNKYIWIIIIWILIILLLVIWVLNNIISYDITKTSIITSIIIILTQYWFKIRLEESIKFENNKEIEKYKFYLNKREEASKIADLFSEWIKFNPKNSKIFEKLTEQEQMEYWTKLNKMIWEFTLWVDDEEIVADLNKRLWNKQDAKDIRQILLDVRKYLLKKENTKLKFNEMVIFHKQ